MIMRGVIKDPRVDSLVSITDVKVSRDIGYADVSISSIEGVNKTRKAADALNHASGFIQHRMRNTLKLRSTPKLRFIVDTSIKDGFDLSQKIDNLE